MANARDKRTPQPRRVGLVRSVRNHMRKMGELNMPPESNAYIGAGWRHIVLHPITIPFRLRGRRGDTSNDFHPTKGWGWPSRRGKRSNG